MQKRTIQAFRAGAALFLLALIPATSALSAETHSSFSPTPVWVDPLSAEYDAPVPKDGVGNGTYYLLFDRQFDVGVTQDETYTHIAMRAINADGVDLVSNLDFDVDPTYQRLTWHFLRVVRSGRAIDQTRTARITALPKETELASRVYDGSVNVNVLLSDVRVGDVVEYAYTLKSKNQLFNGFSSHTSLTWSDYARRIRVLARHPTSIALQHQVRGLELEPTITLDGNTRVISIDRRDVDPIAGDTDRPTWVEQWPSLELSSYRSWADVAQQASVFYPLDASGDQTQLLLAAIREPGGSEEELALRALQRVQQDIRYTSISIGTGSYRPSAPEETLKRGFGDCKDKSVLLASLLQKLGMQANVALVDTDRGEILSTRLPSPFLFDHAIVRVAIGDSAYWIDPTRDLELTPLAAQRSPDYRNALILASSTDALTQMPRPSKHSNRREVQMTFDLTKGIEAPATLSIATTYWNSAADDKRAEIQRSRMADLGKDYLNYYAKYYDGIEADGIPAVEDDPKSRTIIVRELYSLPAAFTKDDEGLLRFNAHADEIYPFGESIEGTVRTTPFAVSHPVSVQQRIKVLLPSEWPKSDEELSVSNPAFTYRSSVRYGDRSVDLSYEYESRSDHVPARLLPKYIKDRDRLYKDAGYALTHDPDATAFKFTAFAWPPLLAFVVLLAAGAWIAKRYVYRYDPEPRNAERGAPVGLMGWMFFPALTTLVSPFLILTGLGSAAFLYSAQGWVSLDSLVSEGNGLWAQIGALALVGAGAVLLPASVLLIVMMYQRRSAFPRLFVILMWLTSAYGVYALAVVSFFANERAFDTKGMADIIGDVASTLIWTAYMGASERVKATFIKRHAPRGTDLSSSSTPPPTAEPLPLGNSL